MKKRAFTLIELLVVIAIIAILAAILFPVFAQAKASAKKAASLSNIKQISLGVIMYGADSDDVIPIMVNWGPAGVNNGAPFYVNNCGYMPWTILTQPYIKNYDLLIDPQAPPTAPAPAGYVAHANKVGVPNYGLNPYLVQPVSFPYATTSTPNQPRSFTAIGRVADTVLLSQKYAQPETASPSSRCGWYFGVGTWCAGVATDPPDCYAPGNIYYCFDGWNDNAFWGGSGGTQWLRNVEAAGAFTGGASMRGAAKLIIAFADGHASVNSAAAMAVGTAYQGAKLPNGIPAQSSTQIAITDITRERYLGLQ